MSTRLLNQVTFVPSAVDGLPFSVACEVFEPHPLGMVGPHNLVVEYLGGTMRLPVSAWLELERQARMSLNLSFQQIRGKTLDAIVAEQRKETTWEDLTLREAIHRSKEADPDRVAFSRTATTFLYKWGHQFDDVLGRDLQKGDRSVWKRVTWTTADVLSTKWHTVSL